MGEMLAAVISAGEEWVSAAERRREGRRQKGMAGSMYPLPEQEQIEKYAEAFDGLAKLFQDLPRQKERLGDEDMEQLFGEVRMNACEGCKREESCWGNYYFQSCRTMYELVLQLEQDGALTQKSLENLAPFCLRPEEVAQALAYSYRQARFTLLWENRMMEQRMAAGEQILRTAELLHRTASGFVGAPERERMLWRRLPRELRYLGLELCNLRVFLCEKERMEIFLALRSVKGINVSARTIAEALSGCCKEKMRPAWDCRAAVSGEPENFHFVPETRYQMLCGISRVTKAGELVSGDNYSFLQKDTGKVVMSLADGMGSGVGACRESEKVIELLEQFLEAGFPQETAVRMINSCMLLQNRNQSFSTIDLCMVDLYSAACDFLKSGAAATFLKRGDDIEILRPGAMPSGLLQQSDYESTHRQLKEADTVIMMTDGVLEALPEEEREELMSDLIRRTAVPNAKEHAQRLMERVYLMQKLQARDDMTILIGTIWKKEP